MSQPEERSQGGDPWHAFGYIVSGVAFYGVLGWLADRVLGTAFLIPVGLVFGAVLGIYLTLKRFGSLVPHERSGAPTSAAPQAAPPADRAGPSS